MIRLLVRVLVRVLIRVRILGLVRIVAGIRVGVIRDHFVGPRRGLLFLLRLGVLLPLWLGVLRVRAGLLLLCFRSRSLRGLNISVAVAVSVSVSIGLGLGVRVGGIVAGALRHPL
ncbi:hypothetical protein [Streptomyces sp. NPDC052693]|uniref:hypothetical protein n=1 Tax=Streptomyces sp. NPDC052693 TaxID=3155814 RepID=UPI003431C67B